MTDDIVPTRQAIEAKNRSGKMTVSGKLKVAVDLMLYQAARRQEAATASGMTDHSLRSALRKPHVASYYNAGLEVLRTSERARNISALVRVRDQVDNSMATVAAAKTLEQLAEPNGPGGTGGGRRGGAGWIIDLSEPAGVVIHIVERVPAPPRQGDDAIDVTPNEK
jgi:hypothetical protein